MHVVGLLWVERCCAHTGNSRVLLVDQRTEHILGFQMAAGDFPYNMTAETLGLTPNVHMVDWAPQNDLLGDPRLTVFFTHGGINSIYEVSFPSAVAFVLMQCWRSAIAATHKLILPMPTPVAQDPAGIAYRSGLKCFGNE